MNEFEPLAPRQIDRLVDGELSQTERRELLIALDQESDGWRKVALAFLESQALRDGLRSSVKPRASADATASFVVTPVQTRAGLSWRSAMVMAACGLLLFTLGRMSNPAAMAPARSVRPETYAGHNVPERITSQIPVADVGPAVRQQTLRLELGDGQDVEVPVVEDSTLRPEDLLKAPPVIPISMQRELLRSGRRVYEQRQLYEVVLEDGRRGVVPVSDVLVENAGWDVYQ